MKIRVFDYNLYNLQFIHVLSKTMCLQRVRKIKEQIPIYKRTIYIYIGMVQNNYNASRHFFRNTNRCSVLGNKSHFMKPIV